MKKYLYPVIVFASILPASAQMVNETVNFDYYISASDNDLVNLFDYGTGLTQLQANGIGGGCLETPLTISWGTDNAVYCTRFQGITGTSYTTEVCFRYDTLQLDAINYDRPVSLWMKPSADPNHYIIGSVLHTGQVQIVSYS